MSDFPDDLFFQLAENQENTYSKVAISDDSQTVFDGDEDIQQFLELSLPKVQVIGVGGGGNNAIDRLMDLGIKGAETIAINTDAQHLLSVKAHKKLLIGPSEKERGLGAGNNPKIGRMAALENIEKIQELISGNLVFVTCGLGGGTGTGVAPVVAELAREMGNLVISICTLPFGMEGQVRKKNADEGLELINRHSDMVVLVPNETLLRIFPTVSVREGLAIANEVLVKSVRGITELITMPQLVNLDFSDVRKVVENSGVGLIGVGETEEGPNQAAEVVARTLNNPLLDGINSAKEASRALVFVAGGSEFTIGAADEIVNLVRGKIHPDAELIWGASVEPSLGNRIRLILIISNSNEVDDNISNIDHLKDFTNDVNSEDSVSTNQIETKGFLSGLKSKITRKEPSISSRTEQSNPEKRATVYKDIEKPAERLDSIPVHRDQEIFVFSSCGVPLAHVSPSWPNFIENGDPIMITGLFSAVQDMADNFIENGGVHQIVTGNKKCIFASQLVGETDFIRGVAILNRHSNEEQARIDLMESIKAVSNLLKQNIPEWEVSDHIEKTNLLKKRASSNKKALFASS